MQKALSQKLEDNISVIEQIFLDCPDYKRQRFHLKDGTPVFIIYAAGLANIDLLQRDIIPSLIELDSSNIFDENLQSTRLPAVNSKIVGDFDALVKHMVNGRTSIFINGFDKAISIGILKSEKRDISEPTIEKNVRGPQEAFVESLYSNISILRRKIRSSRLKFKMLKIGEISNQTVAISYIDGIANPDNLDLLYSKIKDINFDGIFDVGYIEQLISDNPYTPFPHYLVTERPDKVMSCLLEGKFAVILDGTPNALIAPMSFFSAFQAPDDYNSNWLIGSLNRLIRMLALIIAIYLPSLYIAIVSYHYYMVPLNLLVPLAESRARVPFPPIIEVLILELTIEMLREATIRLPTYIGTSIGIVGGLIIGQAAVDAGIVSNLIIIIVAVTALASYLIPNYDMGLAIRYIRFIVMFFSSIFGIIGIVICSLFLLAHMVVLESLEEPYFKPMFPFRWEDFKDIEVRPPLQSLRKRPSLAKPIDKIRGKQNE